MLTELLVKKRKGIITAGICFGIAAFLFALPRLGLSVYFMHTLIGVFIWIIVASSLRLLGLSGQGSIGHAAFMAIGAYTSAILAKFLGWSPWITMPIGVLITLAIAFLVAVPFTRVRGIYFTMVSLFFGIGVLAFNQVFSKYTGGYSGIISIPRLFAYVRTPYYYFCLGLMVICLIIMYRIEHSRIGLTWKAVAQSYTVASSIGINESWQRILCLAVSSCIAGIAGVAYAHYFGILTQETFSFNTSINVFVYMTVGGPGLFAGPIVGTAVLLIIPEELRDLKEYVPFIYAGILLIVLFLMPQGLAGLPGQIREWFNRSTKPTSESPEEGVGKSAP
jgi:ABC-type branched-subunit amino acid transport system permease subunit